MLRRRPISLAWVLLATLVSGGCPLATPVGNSVAEGSGTGASEGDAEETTAGTAMGTGVLIEGCAAIDVLLVVDDTVGMVDAQTRFATAFPGFVTRVREAIGSDDANLLVVASSGAVPPAGLAVHQCEGLGCCLAMCEEGGIVPNPACREDAGEARTCEEWRFDITFNECDASLGAGRIRSGLTDEKCPGSPAMRWTNRLNRPFTQGIQCLARVGEGGNPQEEILGAMQRSAEMSAPGGCNDGFVREDAVLLVVFMSNGKQGSSQWNVESVRDALEATQGDNASTVVMVGLFGDGDAASPVCDEAQAELAPQLRALVDAYGSRGLACSICAGDYDACLADVVPLVALACEDFSYAQ